MPTGGIDIGIGAALSSVVGDVAATAITDALIGAVGGGAIGGITGGGKGILKGAEAGALTGGGAGLGGAALGGFGGSALGGAVGGGLGAEVTGGNPLTGALEGGLGAGLSSAIGGNTNLFGTSGAGGATASPLGGTGQGQGVAAPSGIGGAGGDVTSASATLDPNTGLSNLTDGGGAPSTANTGGGSSAPASSSNVSQTVGTPSISSNTGSAGTDSLVNKFSASQGAEAPVTDALSPQVIAADNAASPGGTGTLNQPGLLAKITGSQSPVAQGTSSVTGAASGVAGGGAAPTPNSIATAFHDPRFSNIASAISNNSGPLLAGAGLAGDALLNNKALPGQKELSKEAGTLAAQGQSLQQYLQTGTLPAGLQGALDEATNASIATIKSQYAAHGMSGSSAEQDAIAQAHERAQASGSQMALQLLQTGVSESEGAAALYQSIMNSALTQDNALGSAIGRFATSAAGGNPQATISIGGKNVTV